jgi:arsenical resistance protein ArsH
MQAASPNLVTELIDLPSIEKLRATPSTHAPRILLLYGSLRERSYSKLLTLEAERLLQMMGAETRVFDPHGESDAGVGTLDAYGDDSEPVVSSQSL